MANKELGYVYIFTNESFREGWVKIGKTQNIKNRLTQLDNTSCPLPFDVYATLKTRRYDVAEHFVHDFISHFNQSLRIRPNREYFKVEPLDALDILYNVKMLMNEPEAEIKVYDEEAKKYIKQLEKKYGTNEIPNVDEGKEPLENETSYNNHTWLICYDKKHFDVEGCFKKYGQIFWKQKGSLVNVQTGDIAYLYSSSPESAFRFKVEVIESQLPYSKDMDVEDEFSLSGGTNSDDTDKTFFLVRPLAETNSSELKLKVLRKRGLMGKRPTTTILSKEKYSTLRDYIENHFVDEPLEVEQKSVRFESGHKKPKKKAKTGHRPPLNFFEMGMHKGDTLVWKDDPSIAVTIISDRKVKYKDEIVSISPLSASLKGYNVPYISPLPCWLFKNKLLNEIYEETYPIE